jgi:hypothetical protein
MAADLAACEHTGRDVQLCGDAHVLNYGLWATPERQLSFDLRDFDETLRGPFEWDLKRYLASLVVLPRDCGLYGGTARRAVRSELGAYRDRLSYYAGAAELEIWYDLVTADDLIQLSEPEERELVSARLAKRARRRTSVGAARKLTRRSMAIRASSKIRRSECGGTIRRVIGAPPNSWRRSCRPTGTACPTSVTTFSTGSPSSMWCARSWGGQPRHASLPGVAGGTLRRQPLVLAGQAGRLVQTAPVARGRRRRC